MSWHVHCRKDTVEAIAQHLTPEAAIEAACRMIDAGYDVYGIGTGPLSDRVGPQHIARIYAIWAADKSLRGDII